MFDKKKLSNRELEVVKQLSMGLDTKAIASNLFITINTVKSHLNNITCKLELLTTCSGRSTKDKILVWYFREHLGIKEDLK